MSAYAPGYGVVRGTREELFDAFEQIIPNLGRETADASFSLDFGLEVLEAWLEVHGLSEAQA